MIDRLIPELTDPQVRKQIERDHVECCDYKVFLDKVSDNSVDLILTDPPYAISKKTGFQSIKKGVKRFAVSMDFGEWDHQEINLNALAEKSYRVLRRGGTIIVFYDLWKISYLREALENANFSMIRLIIWEKKNPMPLNSKSIYLSGSREVAVMGVKGGKPTFNSEYHNGVFEYLKPRRGEKRIHPTQKPDDLFAELVRLHSNRGDTVIDPFLGGGTTAIAAITQGRRFNGCDINPDYIKAVQHRIDMILTTGVDDEKQRQ